MSLDISGLEFPAYGKELLLSEVVPVSNLAFVGVYDTPLFSTNEKGLNDTQMHVALFRTLPVHEWCVRVCLFKSTWSEQRARARFEIVRAFAEHEGKIITVKQCKGIVHQTLLRLVVAKKL